MVASSEIHSNYLAVDTFCWCSTMCLQILN